jgi:hypothetical protein
MKKAWNIDRNNLILRIIVTYLGTRGTASVLINVTDQYAGLGLIVVMSALFSVLYTILFSYYGKHNRIIKICGSVGVIALYSVVNLSNITDGFENIVNLFMQSMSSDPEYEYSVVGNGGIAAAVILVTMIMAVLAAWEVNIRPNMLIALIIILPLPGIFIAAALVPDLISVIACVLFIFDSMALGEKTKRNNNARFMIILSFIAAFVLIFTYPQTDYKRIAFFEETRVMVNDMAYNILGIDLDGNSGTDDDETQRQEASVGVGTGKVGQVDELYYNDKVVGKYTTIANGNIQYISLFKARDFADNNWERWLDTRERDYSYESAAFEFANALIKKKSISLNEDELQLAKRFKMYSPSFTDNYGSHPQFDGPYKFYIKNGNLSAYQEMGELMKKYRTNAVFQSYDNFVKQSYLDVPAEDRMVVEDLFGKIELSDMTDKIDYINYVVGYLRGNYKYTMKPGKVPEGRSVVDYFLKESKKGYCTYFATSAAIILRSAGIPTRYCAGYVVDTRLLDSTDEEKYQTFEVSDNSAHAWVEVYIDGYGWAVVDPTPGYGEEDIVKEPSTNSGVNESEKQTETDITETERETVDSSIDGNIQESTTDKKNISMKFSQNGTMYAAFIIIAVVMCAVIILIIICVSRIVSRQRFLDGDAADSEKLIKMYEYLEKLLAFSGFRRDEDMDYQDYIYGIVASEKELQGIGLEDAVQTILAVRFGNAKYVDKADITGIINTIRQVRSYALKKARGLKKLIVCLI